MESKKYKHKGLGINKLGIEELPTKMFELKEEKNGLGIKKENYRNLILYSSNDVLETKFKLQLINMVDLASKIKGKFPKKSNAFTSSNTYVKIHIYANISTYDKEIDLDSSYPMFERIVSRSTSVFKMDDALLHSLQA